MEQRTQEWFDARKGRVTASLAGALLGMSPHMSKADAMRVLVRSMHDLPSEFQGNVATEYGTFHEEGALAEYKMETGNKVEAKGFLPFQDWLGASPDGLVNTYGMIEIKCPFGKRKENPPIFKSIKELPHYYAQMQIQMFCSDGRDWCDFFQWSPAGTQTERVWEDLDWIDDNITKLHALWEEAKAANPADAAAPKRAIVDTPASKKLVAEYDELSDAIDLATERRKEILASMVLIAGGKDVEISGRKLTRVKKKGSVSYAKALTAAAPDFDLEPYRGDPSESWKFT